MQEEKKCKQRRAGWQREIFLLSFIENLLFVMSILIVRVCLSGHGSLSDHTLHYYLPRSVFTRSFISKRNENQREKHNVGKDYKHSQRRLVMTHEQSSVRVKLNSPDVVL